LILSGDLDGLKAFYKGLDELTKMQIFMSVDQAKLVNLFTKMHGKLDKKLEKELKAFYEVFLPAGWKVKIKVSHHGRVTVRFKIAKQSYKWIHAGFMPWIDFEQDNEDGDMNINLDELLKVVGDDAKAGLDADQLAMVPKVHLTGVAKIKWLLTVDINTLTIADLLEGWSIANAKFKLAPKAVTALPLDLLAALAPQEFMKFDVTIMVNLSSEQYTKVQADTLAGLDKDYLKAVPATEIAALPQTTLLKIAMNLDDQADADLLAKFKVEDMTSTTTGTSGTSGTTSGAKVQLTESDVQKMDIGSMSAEKVASLVKKADIPDSVVMTLSPSVKLQIFMSLGGQSDQAKKFSPPGWKVNAHSKVELDDDAIKALIPGIMLSFSADQMKAFAPTVMIKLTFEQVKNIPVASMTGLMADHVGALAPAAVGGLTAAQVSNIQPDAIAGLTADQAKALTPDAIRGLVPTQVPRLSIQVVMAFTVPQLMNLAPETKPAFTPAQREKMPQFIFDPSYPTDTTTETTETSGSTATTETSGSTATTGTTGTSGTTATTGTSGTTATTGTSGTTATTGTSGSTATTGTSGSTGTTSTTTETPVEVTVDATGQVEMPKATLDTSAGVTTDDVQVDVADLTKPLVVNGETTPPVTEQVAEQLPGFDVKQENGVVSVTGTGDNTGVEVAVVPEKVVVDATAKPGLSTDASGNYVVTTKSGLQITFLSAPKDPVVLYKTLKGKSGKHHVKIKKHGGVYFPAPRGNVLAKFSPFVEKAPAGMAVGVTFNGGFGAVVYPDGTMQQIAPAMPEHTALDTAVRALLAKLGLSVTITFTYNADGTANFTYPSGEAARVVPTFDVKPATTGTTATSGTTDTTATSGTTATEVQPTVELKDASTAEITTSEGTQELKIVPVEGAATGTTATSGTTDTTSTTTGTTGTSDTATGATSTTTGTTGTSDTTTATTGTTATTDTTTATTGTTATTDTTTATTGTTATTDTTTATTGTTATTDTTTATTGTTATTDTTTGTTSATGTTG
jgi:hypothetical protein